MLCSAGQIVVGESERGEEEEGVGVGKSGKGVAMSIRCLGN